MSLKKCRSSFLFLAVLFFYMLLIDLLFFILLTHKGSHREVMTVMTSSIGGTKDCLDHRFHASLSLHRPIANSTSTQNQQPVQDIANQIKPTLRVSRNTQATLEQSPFKYQPSSTLLDFSDCTRTGIFKLISHCA